MNIANGNGQDNMLSSPDFNNTGYQEAVPVKMLAMPRMGVSAWMLTLFLVCIPIVNLIMLIIWACGDKGRDVRVNFARAYLIWTAIQTVLFFLLFLALCTISVGIS